MADQIIRCLGRRRIVVTSDDNQIRLNIWLNDPPRGRQIASLALEPIERDKLLLALTETKANG